MKQIQITIFIFITVIILCVNCTAVQVKRKRIVQVGDLMIGALIPVHEQPNDTDQTQSSKRRCGLIRDQYGVQRVEALLYLLDKINNKSVPGISLPGIKLGLEIRDECWDASIALEETIDFIKDSISSSVDESESNDGGAAIAATTKTLFKNSSYSVVETSGNNCAMNGNSNKMNGINSQSKILAVIGPSGSTVAITVQNLLQLFDIPQVGFSATSADLSNKKMYKTFLRVVPSDYLQVRAMVDIVMKMNWTYLFAVYTDGSYGQAGMEAFRNESVYLNICLAEYEKIQEYATNNDYDALIRKLNKTDNARVIVCFCYGETVRGLLGAIHRLKLKGRFMILGSDGWSDRIDVAKGYYEEAFGSMSVKAYSPVVTEFDDYFVSLTPSNNPRNVWFEEYWQERFKCYLNDDIYRKKFPRACKRKCPANFEYIGSSCFWFSSERMTWPEANSECKSKHYDAELVNLNDKVRLQQVFKYVMSRNDFKKYKYGFHGLFDSTFSQRMVVKDVNIYSCNNKQFPVRGNCPHIEMENNTLINSVNYCMHFNDCNKEMYFICNYDKKKHNGNDEELIYADTLQNYQQDPKMSYVMNSFLAVAYGLNKVHEKVCKGASGLCDEMKKVNGSTLSKFIREAKFVGITQEKIYFNPNGDPPGRYVILNVQKDKTAVDGYAYREVGSWDNEIKLNLSVKELVFPENATEFESQCSKPCPSGYVKQLKGGQKCCWTCKKCEEHAYAIDEFICQECPFGYWPASNITDCYKLPLEYLHWTEPAAIFALFVSFLGTLVTTFVTHIFIKFSNTSVVKSTTKELSFIILAGAYLCYLVTIPLVLRPGMVTCYLARILPGLSLSLVYGALITKTNRISRILSRSKKRILTKKPRFMSIYAQIVITILIITLECAIIVATFVMDPTESMITYPHRNRPRLQCFYSVYTVLGPIGYDLFLVGLCTLYAIRTRNLPENFNEAKFIGFSMYTTCVIWIAFIPLYFGSDFKVITLCLSTSLSATVILIFLFLPKVYIIIFKPERNQRSAFATSKDLRCHFGSSNPVRQDSASVSASEHEKSFMSSKKSYGMSMLEKIGIKTSLTVSVKSDSASSTNGTRTNFREARDNTSNNHRPKPKNANSHQDRSSDSLVTRSSSIQMFDRSCQTSQELMVPMLDRELRRRKAYGVSMFDDSDAMNRILNKINDNFDEANTPPDDDEKHRRMTRSLSVFGKFQNYLVPTIEDLRTKVAAIEDLNDGDLGLKEFKEKMKVYEDDERRHEVKEISNAKSDHSGFKNRRFLSKSFKTIQSKFSENKNLFKIGSLKRKVAKEEIPLRIADNIEELAERLKNDDEDDDDDGCTLHEPAVDIICYKNSPKRSQIENISNTNSPLQKIPEVIEDQNSSNESNSSSDDTTTNPNEQYAQQTLNDDSSISSSLSNINLTDYYNFENSRKDNNFNRIIEEAFDPSSDIEHELMMKLEQEDDNLEKFKRILTRDKGLVLNWDYVQSSDYL